MSITFTTVPAKSLYQPLLSTDTTFKLADITGFNGNNLTASDFGTVGYGVLLNSDRSVMELFSWDPTTIASTSISFVSRGLPFTGSGASVTAYKLDWPAGSTVLLGSDTPQFIQWLKDYIDSVAIAGAPNASTVLQGLVQESTQAQRDAGTSVGSTGAKLFGTPATERGKLINDYAVDASGTDAYEITITPAITAYATGQVFTFKAGTANTGAATLNVSGLGAKTIKKNVSTDLETGDILANQIVTVIYDGTNMQLQSKTSKTYIATGIYSFGGDGSDGVLNVTSGTTTIDLGNASIFTKNYTSINVSAGATLTFSNPNNNGTIIQLKSQGAVTIAGTVDAQGMGAQGQALISTAGQDGVNPNGILGTENQYGTKGIYDTGAGSAGAVATLKPFYAYNNFIITSKMVDLIPGASGGGGGSGRNNTPAAVDGGIGGNGGGAVYIECAGALNFTGTINTSGTAGGTGANVGDIGFTGMGSGSGGGGGAAGMQVIIYNTLTANSGTMTASGGNGGSSGIVTGVGSNGMTTGSGGGAGSIVSGGAAGVTGGNNGTNAPGLGAGGSGGGGSSTAGQTARTGGTGGGSMGGIVIKNTMFN